MEPLRTLSLESASPALAREYARVDAALASRATPLAGPWPRALVAGGRAITMKSLTSLFEKAGRDELDLLTFLDLDWNAVNKQLDREKQTRRSGPAAEAMLRDLGTVASKIS